MCIKILSRPKIVLRALKDGHNGKSSNCSSSQVNLFNFIRQTGKLQSPFLLIKMSDVILRFGEIFSVAETIKLKYPFIQSSFIENYKHIANSIYTLPRLHSLLIAREIRYCINRNYISFNIHVA